MFIVITENHEEFRNKIRINLNRLITLSRDYKKLKSLFKAPSYGTNYLVNKSGDFIFRGRNFLGYERGVKVSLMHLIDNEYFNIMNLVTPNEHINNLEWFRQVSDIINKNKKKYYIISMFTSICEGCPSFSIIDLMKDLHLKSQQHAYFLSILHNKYNQNDIINLRSQLGIKHPIFIADNALIEKWNYFIKKFRENDLNNIVFILDESGKIIKLLDPGDAKSWSPFFKYLRALVAT
jgi:hypothetical protein